MPGGIPPLRDGLAVFAFSHGVHLGMTALEGQRVLVAVNQGAPIAMRAMAPGECWQACGAGLRAYRWRRGTPGLPLAAW